MALSLAPLSATWAQEPSQSLARCNGLGAVESIRLDDWESGLGGWTAGTYSVFDPLTFDTPDWSIASALPDGRPGNSAFVPNLDIGDCATDDESGVLFLESPSIIIPADVEVPRLSLDHWFDIESSWDGGNLKISVNGGGFQLVPAEAFEKRPYTQTLEPAFEGPDSPLNSNPLAEQAAFSGNDGDAAGGRWGQSRVNLFGLAGAGDTIRLRLDFGIDCNGGAVGWYVDTLEVYGCAAEAAPSDCGNEVLNGGEQCDDGNILNGDGCSNDCRVEGGWTCTAPLPAGVIGDFSFEAGTPNPEWDEFSTSNRGTPICSIEECLNNGGGTGPSDGVFWAWFGGAFGYSEKSLSQQVQIPTTATQLLFDFEIPRCDSGSDYVEVSIDGDQVWSASGADPRCGEVGYILQAVDITAYADGGTHSLELHSETFGYNGLFSNMFIDVVEIPGEPSHCRRPGTNLNLQLQVFNDAGGNAYASDWILDASGPSPFSGPGPVAYSGSGFLAGTYDLSVFGPTPGYSVSDWECTGGSQVDGDTVTVPTDGIVTCTAVANDIAPRVTVVKTVINDHNGPESDPDAFGLKLDGQTVLNQQSNSVLVGDHRVSEIGLPDYLPGPWGGDCTPEGELLLSLAQEAVCTITNDDAAASLTLIKTIVNDNGGSVSDPNAFGLRVDGELVLDGVATEMGAGQHVASEDGLPGYIAGDWGGDCAPDGSITLALGQHATCTVTNDDNGLASLTLIKEVTNDNGGTATADAWTMTASGPAGFSGSGPIVSSGEGILPGNYDLSESGGPTGYTSGGWACEGGVQVDNDTVAVDLGQTVVCRITNDDITPTLTVFNTVINNDGGSVFDPDQFQLRIDDTPISNGIEYVLDAGAYSVSQTDIAGYQPGSWQGDCAPDGLVTLLPGDAATCTISNDDIPPWLTLRKIIVNDDEGAVEDPNAFGLRINGDLVPHDVPVELRAGRHVASEDGLAGYVGGVWGGDCNPDGSITLALAETAVCTIVNDDEDTISLTLFKDVVNDSGGDTPPSAWTLTATGPSGFSGPGPSVSSGTGFQAGSYTLSESGGDPAYFARPWVCVGGTQTGPDTIFLVPGDAATCTVTNDDLSPTLKVTNTIVNDDGGTNFDANAFGLAVNGFTVFDGQINAFPAGDHVVSASGLAGYGAGAWGGDCNPDGTITLVLDQDAHCTITHDDIAPTLTVVKTIVNDDGGTELNPDAFQLRIDGEAVLNEAVNTIDAGNHTVSEAGLEGYIPGLWGGDCNADGTITLALDDDAVCSITNDDTPASSLTLVKQIVNDNGGTRPASDWTLTAAGPENIQGAGPIVSQTNITPGSYDLSESGPGGYSASGWLCTGGVLSGAQLTLAESESVTCTIINDDAPPALLLDVIVVNNGGGGAGEAEWTLAASGPTPISGPGTSSDIDVASGPTFQAGTYTLSASGPGGYSQGEWTCEGGDQVGDEVSLQLGETVTCSVVFDDLATSLVLNKVVLNDNGGQALESAWTLMASGPDILSGPGGPGDADVLSGPEFSAGTYLLSSAGPAGYTTGAWECAGGTQNGAELTLALGESATCTVASNDNPPSLILDLGLSVDNGGSALESDWTLGATGPTPISGMGSAGSGDVSSGASFAAGSYQLAASGPEGYETSGWVCSGGAQNGDQIDLGLGVAATCAIAYDDIAPSLVLDKQVINDDGGDETEEAWTLSASGGSTPISGPGATGSEDVVSGPDFTVGIYTLAETGPEGYETTGWTCVGAEQAGTQISLQLGDVAVCTIVNDDLGADLTLILDVVNDDGGTAVASAWILSASGPSGFGGPGPSVNSESPFQSGTYTLSLSGPDGYTDSGWNCSGGTQSGDEIELNPGESATCNVSVDDDRPTLTLVNTIVNDDGGVQEDPNAFLLSIDGQAVASGTPIDLDAGEHLAMAEGLAGYDAGDWGGSCDAEGNVTVEPGDAAVCTITHDDIAPTLRLIKTVRNDNGGAETDPDAFDLRIDGETVFHNEVTTLEAGNHVVSETADDRYEASPWGGDCAPDGSIVLELAQEAVCSITNDDKAPSLTLVKQVVNNDGGTATAADWTLIASGPTGFSGNGPEVTSGAHFVAGLYELSETGGPGGYTAGDWDCTGGTQWDANTIELDNGESAVCTLINTDNAEPIIFRDGFEAP